MPSVYVIEDNYALRRLYVRALKNAGWMVEDDALVVDASANLMHKNYDIVLCDLELFDGNGLGFLDLCRSRGIAIVVMSADDSCLPEALANGVSHHLTKPFLIRQMLSLVEEVYHLNANPR